MFVNFYDLEGFQHVSLECNLHYDYTFKWIIV